MLVQATLGMSDAMMKTMFESSARQRGGVTYAGRNDGLGWNIAWRACSRAYLIARVDQAE